MLLAKHIHVFDKNRKASKRLIWPAFCLSILRISVQKYRPSSQSSVFSRKLSTSRTLETPQHIYSRCILSRSTSKYLFFADCPRQLPEYVGFVLYFLLDPLFFPLRAPLLLSLQLPRSSLFLFFPPFGEFSGTVAALRNFPPFCRAQHFSSIELRLSLPLCHSRPSI